MELKNKTIILTGGARMGEAIVAKLKERGANIVATYFKDPIEAKDLGFAVQADVSKQEDVERVIATAIKEFGCVDGLVHLAATYERVPWEKLDEAAWQRSMDVIAKSAFLFGKLAGDAMLKNPSVNSGQAPSTNSTSSGQANSGQVKGHMIFFSDWSVLARPYKDYLAYNVAKSAVVGLTKSLAKELAPHILVNAIAPGPIIRPPDLSEAENEEVLSKTLLGRWGGPEEIAKGVLFLLESDFMTGQVLTIDGGRTIA